MTAQAELKVANFTGQYPEWERAYANTIVTYTKNGEIKTYSKQFEGYI
jgi:hypothetical protein